ncbi:unnamed protein product [Wuchereria bancrofti]|nr:unnamed protein product [Wuchereria bancrofti]
MMDDKIDKHLTIINDNLTDEFFLKGIGNDDDNIITTTTSDIIIGDIPVIITTDSLEEIRLLINGRCSMV